MTDWNESDVERLRSLWEEGHSSAKIGELLGITKNAVVGKAHRLGLVSRPSPIKKLAEGEIRPIKPKVVRQGEPTLPPLPVTMAALIPPPAAKPIMVAPMRSEPEPTRIEVVVAQFPRVGRPCCWPLGKLKTPSFRYCEDPSVVGKPYCEHHCSIAYVQRPRLQLIAAE